MKLAAIALVFLMGGCASGGPLAIAKTDACRPEVDRLQAQLAAEIAERQRVTRAAARREETLRKQLEAMKSIERGILEREDRARTETR
jgi:hypothetical protein